MKIAVLFDGAGLARLGLEQAGHECTGFEISPSKHYLSKMVGSGNCVLADATKVDLSVYDAVWASPPCQKRSQALTNANYLLRREKYDPLDDLLSYSLSIQDRFPNIKVLWVENVFAKRKVDNLWGNYWNAVQFLEIPIQNRSRIIGGSYAHPHVYREFKRYYPKLQPICPTITASEYKGGVNGFKRASVWYGRRIWIEEAAYHQGFAIPRDLLKSWYHIPYLKHPEKHRSYTWREWLIELYEAIGNGVPVYMARAFGEAYN